MANKLQGSKPLRDIFFKAERLLRVHAHPDKICNKHQSDGTGAPPPWVRDGFPCGLIPAASPFYYRDPESEMLAPIALQTKRLCAAQLF